MEIDSEYPGSFMDIHNLRLDLLDLQRWCNQGILLLNTALTVEANKTGSHLDIWRLFTIKIIHTLNLKGDLVYLLLGKEAQKYEKYISTKHRIVVAAHPAAEAYNGGKAGFFGSNCFKEVNQCLKEANLPEIIW